MSTALPLDPLVAWLVQQVPVVVVLALLTIALWRKNNDLEQIVAANTSHIASLANDIDRVVDHTEKIGILIVSAATISVLTVVVAVVISGFGFRAKPIKR